MVPLWRPLTKSDFRSVSAKGGEPCSAVSLKVNDHEPGCGIACGLVKFHAIVEELYASVVAGQHSKPGGADLG